MPKRSRQGPVVVTGGAGAIGSVLVGELLAAGRTVRVIDNLSSGRRAHLPAAATPGLSVTVADLKEPPTYSAALEGASEVWHLAANTDIQKASRIGSRLDLDEGVIASVRLLEEVRRHDVPEFAYASSSVVYGFPSRFPTPEEYGPLQPESFYGAAKLAVEGFVSSYAHGYGLTAHLFRFANIIGPHMTHGVLFDFFGKLAADPTRLEVLGDGRQSKSYLRTEDCIAGMRLAVERTDRPVNVFNLGTADRISVREIAEKVVEAHGGRARIEYTGGERGWLGDVPQQLLAIDRIRALGWVPRCSSSEAVDRTIAEMLAERGLVLGTSHRGRDSAATRS
jgi:UDP-glucose 4-epimerase